MALLFSIWLIELRQSGYINQITCVPAVCVHPLLGLITFAPGEECEGNACGSVCLSVSMRNSKSGVPVDWISLLNDPLGSVLL